MIGAAKRRDSPAPHLQPPTSAGPPARTVAVPGRRAMTTKCQGSEGGRADPGVLCGRCLVGLERLEGSCPDRSFGGRPGPALSLRRVLVPAPGRRRAAAGNPAVRYEPYARFRGPGTAARPTDPGQRGTPVTPRTERNTRASGRGSSEGESRCRRATPCRRGNPPVTPAPRASVFRVRTMIVESSDGRPVGFSTIMEPPDGTGPHQPLRPHEKHQPCSTPEPVRPPSLP